jgi:hypothetical protein
MAVRMAGIRVEGRWTRLGCGQGDLYYSLSGLSTLGFSIMAQALWLWMDS